VAERAPWMVSGSEDVCLESLHVCINLHPCLARSAWLRCYDDVPKPKPPLIFDACMDLITMV